MFHLSYSCANIPNHLSQINYRAADFRFHSPRNEISEELSPFRVRLVDSLVGISLSPSFTGDLAYQIYEACHFSKSSNNVHRTVYVNIQLHALGLLGIQLHAVCQSRTFRLRTSFPESCLSGAEICCQHEAIPRERPVRYQALSLPSLSWQAAERELSLSAIRYTTNATSSVAFRHLVNHLDPVRCAFRER